MRDQVITLLANGATQEEILKITGISSDLFGEFLKDKEFLEEVKVARESKRQELIEQGYARLEQHTLARLKDQVEFADVPALCRILETTAKNRVLHRNPAGHYTNPTAHLTVEIKMPQGADSAKVVLDHATSQIVAIGDRNMAAMPLGGVTKLFKQLDDKEKIKERVRELSPVQQAEADIESDIGPEKDHAYTRHVSQTTEDATDYEPGAESSPKRAVA